MQQASFRGARREVSLVDQRQEFVRLFQQPDVNREQSHNSRALLNANDDTRLVFSSKIKVRVIGGSAR
jgi:hypothetical protein